MYIEISVERLLTALGYAIGVIEKRSTLPILGYFLVRATDERLEIVSTDLEIEIETFANATIDDEGACVIPGRKLFDICRSLPKESQLKIRTEDGKAGITAGRSRFSLLTFTEQDYPRLGLTGIRDEMELDVETLRLLIDKTSFSVAQQDVRYYLNGLFVACANDKIIGVTTDGHRLSKAEVTVEGTNGNETEVIIPGKAVQELKRILSGSDRETRVSLAFREGLVSLTIGNIVFHTKLIDAKYPDYERVIPQNLTRRAIVDKELLRSALVRMSAISYDKYRGVEFIFDEGTLRLVSKNSEQEIAEEDFDVAYDGDKMSVAFNSSYVVDVLSAITSETIEVNFTDGNTSSIWRGEDSEAETYVIMPMRL